MLRAMRSVYEAAGGAEGLHRLAAAWHALVLADPVVSHKATHHAGELAGITSAAG